MSGCYAQLHIAKKKGASVLFNGNFILMLAGKQPEKKGTRNICIHNKFMYLWFLSHWLWFAIEFANMTCNMHFEMLFHAWGVLKKHKRWNAMGFLDPSHSTQGWYWKQNMNTNNQLSVSTACIMCSMFAVFKSKTFPIHFFEECNKGIEIKKL